MPFQVSGQFVTTKSSRLPHVAGGGGAFVVKAGAAFVAMVSSADASAAYATPTSPRNIAVETPNFFMLLPLVYLNLDSVFTTRSIQRYILSDREASFQELLFAPACLLRPSPSSGKNPRHPLPNSRQSPLYVLAAQDSVASTGSVN